MCFRHEVRDLEMGGKAAGGESAARVASCASHQQRDDTATNCDETDRDLLHGKFPLACRPPPLPLRATGPIRSAQGCLCEEFSEPSPRPCRLSLGPFVREAPPS